MPTSLILAAAALLCEPYEDGARQLYGYSDCDGRPAVAAKYLFADRFTRGGIAAVLDGSGWYYIDRHGREVIRPYIYDNGPDPFSEGLARFVENGRYGFFDEAGTVRVRPRFEFAFPFENGRAKVGERCRFTSDGEHRQVDCAAWHYIERP